VTHEVATGWWALHEVGPMVGLMHARRRGPGPIVTWRLHVWVSCREHHPLLGWTSWTTRRHAKDAKGGTVPQNTAWHVVAVGRHVVAVGIVENAIRTATRRTNAKFCGEPSWYSSV